MKSCKDFNDIKNNKQLTTNRPGPFPGHEKTRRQ
jgi:hypothetical protein